MFPKVSSGERARVGSMVNICERLINVVMSNKPWTQQQAWLKSNVARHKGCMIPCHGRQTLPADRADLTCHGYLSGTW